MKAVVYVRNSSGKQAERGTHEGQLVEAERTAARLGARVAAVYADRGISAKSGNLAARGDFARLVAELPALKPDICIVANVDRLTRTELFRELGAVWGPLQEAGVKVATAGGQILDLGTPDGQLLAMFESWRSARENAARSERSRTGRARAAREGRSPGRHPYGYAFVGGKWAAPGADVVRDAFARAAAGESCEAIAGDFNRRGIPSAFGRKWSGAVVRDMVRPRVATRRRPNGDPYVTGLWIGHHDAPPIAVPKLIDPETAQRARAMIAGRAHSPPAKNRRTYLLDHGAGVCGLCAAKIRVTGTRGRRHKDGSLREVLTYYTCERRTRRVADGSGGCALPNRRTDAVDAEVWRVVVARVEGGSLVVVAGRELAAASDSARDDLEEAERRLAGEELRLEALAEALGSGAMTAETYRAQVERVTRRRNLLRTQVATWAEAASRELGSEPTAGERAELRLKVRAAASLEARREIVRDLYPEWRFDLEGVEAIRAGAGIGEPIPLPARIVVAQK